MSETPRWMRDLRQFLPLRSQFLLSGNVRDRYPISIEGGAPLFLPLVEYLTCELARPGHSRVIAFDPVSGLVPAAVPGAGQFLSSVFFSSLAVKFDDANLPGSCFGDVFSLR